MLLIWIFLVFIAYSSQESVERPLVIGHRGVAYLPEETSAALSMGHAYDADILEMDVCLSRDNQLIVVHDIYLDAVTNVKEVFPSRHRPDGLNYVIDFDLAELRRLSVRERVDPLNNNQVFPGRFPSRANIDFRLLTLNETIELLLGLNRATGRRKELLIEIKKPEYHSEYRRSISSLVLSTLAAYNLTEATDPIIIQTFHIEELINMRENFGTRLRLFALMTWNFYNESSSDYDFYRSEQGIKSLSKVVQALAPNLQMVVNFNLSGEIINATDLTKWAHQNNLKVYPFTFRTDGFPRILFERMVEYCHKTVEVDGFITDNPDIVMEILLRKTTSSNGVDFSLNFFIDLLKILILNWILRFF